MHKFLAGSIALTLFSVGAFAQNNRVADQNNVGWFTNNTTFQLTKKWGIHAEYQWRRDDFVTNWQQSLARFGVNYQVAPGVLLRAGGAYIDTYNYGDIPLQAAGRTFPEYRTFQMVQLAEKKGRVDFSHRFMLEQRWVKSFSDASLPKADRTTYQNRLRYMFRMQVPLNKPTMNNNTFYAAAYDEIFIGFGENVNANVFDQNRLGLLLGYRFNNTVRVEGGYFNQIVQLGRLVNNRNVFQYNGGFIINSFINLDLQKKKK